LNEEAVKKILAKKLGKSYGQNKIKIVIDHTGKAGTV
jgi:hypothetical protein